MEREVAFRTLSALIGNDLVKLADKNEIDIFVNSKKQKGWAGHVLEAELGLARNSSRAPNFGSWELKCASFKKRKTGSGFCAKETLAICMIDPREVSRKTFAESHLAQKMRKMLIAGREWVNESEPRSLLLAVEEFDLEGEMRRVIEEDYNLIRDTIREHNGATDGLSGHMGTLIQPRTKGQGRGAPRTRAFYARTCFVNNVFAL